MDWVPVNAQQLLTVVEKAEESNGFAAAPLSNRYQAFLRQANKLIDEGKYGPMPHIYYGMSYPTAARYPEWGELGQTALRRR